MSIVKRLCTAACSLAALFALAAFGLTWYGPWTGRASALFSVRAYSLAVQACVVVAVAGALVALVRALLSRRTRTVEVARVDGGSITVTRDAIAAQAAHVVEVDGTCVADRVRVDAKPHGDVRVHVRVLPRRPMDVVARGTQLHHELLEGLAVVCGSTVRSVGVEFVQPESDDDGTSGPESVEQRVAEPAAAPDDAFAPEPVAAEITVPMASAQPRATGDEGEE